MSDLVPPDKLAHAKEFQNWMAHDGYAMQTQKEYPYFINRYVKAFGREINERTLTSEADVLAIVQDVERALHHGGRGAGEFNIHDLKNNLRPALRLYVRSISEQFLRLIAVDVPTDELPERLRVALSRVVRDSNIVREVKTAHSDICQLCAGRLELAPGRFYSEGHHLKILGSNHNGPDVKENILCVCPNCHAKLDFAAIKIDPHRLRQSKGHFIRQEFIDYHNGIRLEE